jgi:hypothetical protein
MQVFVTLIETDGNQRYIFGTNRLRQNIGASELIFRVGTQVVLEAVRRAGGPECWSERTAQRAAWLLDDARNRPIEKDAQCEVVVATSGRSILLTHTRAMGKRIVSEVTGWALRHAPGLSVVGCTAAVEFPSGDVHEKIVELTRERSALRSALPPPESRFLRLPIFAECKTTGLPASAWDQPTGNEAPALQSEVARAKYAKTQEAIDRLGKSLGEDLPIPRTLRELEEMVGRLQWLAVVHADGNGVGRLFARLGHHLRDSGQGVDGRVYVNELRRLSLGLELGAETAFASALKAVGETRPEGDIPVVPLVLGGDDFTALCDGSLAVDLVREFLIAFEDVTGGDIAPAGDTVRRVVRQVRQAEGVQGDHGVDRLGACAGVAIVKPHFPFYAAYDLADELLDGAKVVKQRVNGLDGKDVTCSAFDVHMLAASSGASLDLIRHDRVARRDGRHLWGGPYVVTPVPSLGALSPDAHDWLKRHHVEELDRRVDAIRDVDDDGRRRLPTGALHDLRAALGEGKAQCDALVRLLKPRLGERGLDTLLEHEDSLFRPGGDGKPDASMFLDAMDLADLGGTR